MIDFVETVKIDDPWLDESFSLLSCIEKATLSSVERIELYRED